MQKKIVIELEGASSRQLQTLAAELALGLQPWKRYIKYKIKTGSKQYKLQPLRFRHQTQRPSARA